MVEGKVIATSKFGIKVNQNWLNGNYEGIYKGDYVRVETEEKNPKNIKSILKIEAPKKAMESGPDVLGTIIERQIDLWKKLSEALEKENWLGFQSEDARQKILTSLAIEMNKK